MIFQFTKAILKLKDVWKTDPWKTFPNWQQIWLSTAIIRQCVQVSVVFYVMTRDGGVRNSEFSST